MKKLKKKIQNINKGIEVSEKLGAVHLEGRVSTWEEYIRLGYIAADSKYRGVINDIQVQGLSIPENHQQKNEINEEDPYLEGKEMDVLIVGGGVIGCAIAYYLSKWDLSVLLVEKENDVAVHQSSRNDGMVHPGLVPKPGSQKAKYNVRGNQLFEELANDLDVPFERKGTLMLFDKRWMKIFKTAVLRRASKNGVPGVRVVKGKELRQMEPYLNDDILWAMHMPSTGVCPPYKMTVALAEGAIQNGVEFSLETRVLDMVKEHAEIVKVKTSKGTVYPKLVINAAGLFSDKIAKMAGDQFFTIHPRKGEIILLDKNKSCFVNHVLAAFSTDSVHSKTKGGGMVPTYEGNILLGPNAYEQPYREDYSTHKESIEAILNKNLSYVEGLKSRDIITYLAGTRAATFKEDFIVEKSLYVDNLIHSAGIQSPGFASAPAIAEEIERLTVAHMRQFGEVRKNSFYRSNRKGIPQMNMMGDEERNAYIKERPAYGEIICRCEEISRGEIIDAIRSPLPAVTIDSIKRRTRAGMGRCQGGFCTPFIAKIISEETNQPLRQVMKKGGDSHLLVEDIYKGERVHDV